MAVERSGSSGASSRRHRQEKMNGNRDEDLPLQPYRIHVSIKFILTSLMASTLLAYSIGRAARHVLLNNNAHDKATFSSLQYEKYVTPLPALVVKEGKKPPKSRYYSKNFDSTMSASTSVWLNYERDENNLGGGDARQCHLKKNGEGQCLKEDEEVEDDDDDEDDDDEEEEEEREQNPSAEHLMVDMKHVSSAFLNSERRLAQAIVDLVEEADLTLLSYHCHGLTPAGVSCVGVLIQNYISFHTWPEEGVITFDLCVGGNISILPTLPAIKRLFGVPRGPGEPEPEMRWAFKMRGYRPRPDRYTSVLSGGTDLARYMLGDLDSAMKTEVASVETEYQRIDIYDTIDPEEEYALYLKSLANDGSYESRHPVSFRPDRAVMLDGWIQSLRDGEIAYHEALVHPALFTHPKPKRVAIIGGGEMATLREVLKHNTVEKAIMIEIDEVMVNVSRKYLPEWSNCTDFGASWCGDDTRADIYYEDALAWFMNRYPNGKEPKEKLMDVIIMDALDPEANVPFAKLLYSNNAVMQSFYDALSDDGVFVMQLGESSSHICPSETYSFAQNRAATTRLLEEVGFESIHAYEESHCGFTAPWTFLIAFKSYASRARWYANSAEIDLEISRRKVKTKSGTNPIKYFDGATMFTYQVPPKAMEIVYCRQDPTPEDCLDDYTYDPEIPNIPARLLEVKTSGEGENAGRGVFTKVDIPEDAYLSAETSCHPVRFMPSTKALLLAIDDLEEKIQADNLHMEAMEQYMSGYGCYSQLLGKADAVVDSSILTFANHGCNGKYNIGIETEFDESTADTTIMPDEVVEKKQATFNPLIDRHIFHTGVQALKDIPAGAEILDNYLSFTAEAHFWSRDVIDLREQCAGSAAGEVVTIERGNKSGSDSAI